MTTAADIRHLIESGIESDPVPDLLLEYLKEHDGKILTQRDIPKINARVRARGLTQAVWIQKIAGMTNLKWANGSLLIAHTEAAPTINASWIEEYGVGYFAARRERNEARRRALASEVPHYAATLINQINEAAARLEELLDYGSVLNTERYEIEKLVEWNR